MNSANEVTRAEQAAFGLLLRAWPAALREEYASEMRDVFACMTGQAARGGTALRVRVWLRVLLDVARSAPLERWHSLLERTAAARARGIPAVDFAGALTAACAVLVLYWITLAPSIAFWDAGEYITVGHVLGIPHPPGNPLFVMLARAWDVLLAPAGWPAAMRINLLSAVCSAGAHFFLFLIIERSFRPADTTTRRVAAACAVALSATAFTVWHQSNVNEKVYTVSFLTTMAALWLAVRWRDTRNPKLLILAAYITVLSATNHMMGVLVAPAVLLFVLRVDARTLLSRRIWAVTLSFAVLALSAQLFLPIRAAQRPVVNESDPVCATLASAAVSIYTNGARGCEALSANLTREQYAKPSVLRDPNAPETTRGLTLVLSQFVNYAQYLDWQWARSIAGRDPLFGGARPLVSLLVLLLTIAGARAHWRADRNAALLHGAALAVLSIGLVLYLNFRWGFSIGRDTFADPELHEVRERDYFFLIGFSLYGAWAGVGIAALWRALSLRVARAAAESPLSSRIASIATPLLAPRIARFATRPKLPPRMAAAPLLALALVPLALNWAWASRADDWTARDWAYNVLMSVEPYGVLVTNGDNDSFPLWYLQHVERVREDVTIVLSPYLAMPSYVRQVRDMSRACRRHGSVDDPTRITCQRPFEEREVHPRLLAAWGGIPAAAPDDSILPYDDAEIDTMAAGWYVAPEDLELRFDSLTATVAKGTVISPIDTFVAAIVQSSYGERPIHFMTPSPVAARLGLTEHAVRVGLTWRLRESDDRGLIRMPAEGQGSVGAFVDLPLTDTLARDVFIVRGRVADPHQPWVDHANYSIPVQYSLMHFAAAHAAELRGIRDSMSWHAERLAFWNGL